MITELLGVSFSPSLFSGIHCHRWLPLNYYMGAFYSLVLIHVFWHSPKRQPCPISSNYFYNWICPLFLTYFFKLTVFVHGLLCPFCVSPLQAERTLILSSFLINFQELCCMSVFFQPVRPIARPKKKREGGKTLIIKG